MSEKVVIYIRQSGARAEQQQVACLEYCDRRRYQAESICRHPQDAVALAEAGVITVVVTAYDEEEDAELARRLRRAEVRLEYVRAPRRTVRHVRDDDLAIGMHQRGATVEQIAELVGETTRDIRALLRRLGHRPPG